MIEAGDYCFIGESLCFADSVRKEYSLLNEEEGENKVALFARWR